MLLLTVVAVVVEAQSPVRFSPVVVNETTPGSCPTGINTARMNTREAVEQLFDTAPCGGLGWTQIASIDMADVAQECPPPFILTNVPQRSCTPRDGNCPGVTFPGPGAPYNRVCGRIYGYGVRTPDAFHNGAPTIDGPYLDGISLTYGSPRQHIWSFAAGHGDAFGVENIRCPCGNTNRDIAPLPPTFVGSNYYCDNLNNGGELWDAMECMNDCCTFNNPPEFSVTLAAPTTAGVEMRLCHNQIVADETVHFRLVQLYVQ